MGDAHGVQIVQCCDDLFQVGSGEFLGKFTSFGYIIEEVTALCKLQNNQRSLLNWLVCKFEWYLLVMVEHLDVIFVISFC